MASTRSPIVGIDLGTTNSVVAAWDPGGNPVVLADDSGFKIQPSVVAFHPNGSVVVGAEAKQRRIIDPRNTVYSAKRLIGRTFRSREVTAARERMAYQIKEGVNQQPVIVTRAGEFAIPEISAIVLDHMRRLAERQLGTTVNRAVVTVPANFTDAQRSATATAGAIAGITVVRVLNEPTAAALAYGHNRQLDKTIAVYDFGGGTFDITLLRLQESVFQVLSTAGDSFLGGDDIDERLVDHMVRLFLERQRIDLRSNITSMQRLRAVAEQIKIELSRKRRAVVKIDEIAYGQGGVPLDLELEISRNELVDRSADVVERTFPVCAEALSSAGLRTDDIDDVVLVGGTTKMPLVRDRVAEFFGRTPRTDINPDEAVAAGAALQGESLERILGRAQTGARAASPASRTLLDGVAPTRRTAPGPFPVAPDDEPTELGDEEPTREIGDEEPTREIGDEPTVELSEELITMPGDEPVTRPGDEETTAVRDERGAGHRPPPIPPRRRTRPGLPASRPPGVTERPPSAGHQIDDLGSPAAPAGAPLGRLVRPESEPTIPKRTLMGAPAPSRSATTESGEPTEIDQLNPSGGGPAAPTADRGPTAAPSAPTRIDQDAEPFQLRAAGVAAPAPPVTTVLDVTPHTLGIGTIAGYCEPLIGRNSQVPAESKQSFATSRDFQNVVRIRVCQGESRRLDENVPLGDLVLEGLEPRPRGQTRIEVTFHIDANGILHVRARDEATGKEQRANLDIQGAQSAEEIDAARARLREIRR